MIQLNKYAKFNRNGRLKEITTVQIIDKLTKTSNSNRTKYSLYTNIGTVNVSEKIYNKVTTNDNIELHKASFLKIWIGVSFNNGYEYFENL